jgi:hypothetical protein
MSNPFMKNHVALTDVDIKNFLDSHKIQSQILTLQELNENPFQADMNCVIFTGNTGNKYNTLPKKTITSVAGTFTADSKELTHHWMGLYGENCFDSYGFYEDYTWPTDIKITYVKCFPSRLQEYNSNVCGEYVLRFLYYCNCEHNSSSYKFLGKDFSTFCGFGIDRRENDKIVLDWYNETKKD